jgi:hypothetical protein
MRIGEEKLSALHLLPRRSSADMDPSLSLEISEKRPTATSYRLVALKTTVFQL